MSDIVERLRADLASGLSASIGDTREAAAEIERLREVLRPFAAVAEHDIGDDEVDGDYYRQPMSLRWAKAPVKIGDFRRARAALSPSRPGSTSTEGA